MKENKTAVVTSNALNVIQDWQEAHNWYPQTLRDIGDYLIEMAMDAPDLSSQKALEWIRELRDIEKGMQLIIKTEEEKVHVYNCK